MQETIELLIKNKYLILFPLAVVEGPVIAIIAGMLCTKGILNLWIVFPIIVVGDVTGDSVCYAAGAWGLPGWVKKIILRMGMTREKLDRVKILFNANPVRIIFLSKVTLGIGVVGIYMSGSAKIPVYKFLKTCFLTSVFQYIIYLSIGLLFGQFYIRINHYLNKFASFSIACFLAILLFFIIKSKASKI